jgi:hypothetical protein
VGRGSEEVDVNEHSGIVGAVEFQTDANVTKSVVGLVKARDVHLTGSGAGLVAAGANFSILNGGCGPVVANGAVTIRNGGCGPLIASGDVSIENGGTQAVFAAGEATIGPNAFVGIVVSPKVAVEDGARVLLSSPLAMAVGACAGIAISALTRWIRR